MKLIITILTFFIAVAVNAQQYVDLVKFSYGNSESLAFSNNQGTSNISDLELSLTLPIVLNEKTALITGIDYLNNRLRVNPNQNSVLIQSTTLKLGANIQHNDRLSGTYMLLPKIAGDYENITGDDFQLGGIALLSLTKNQYLKYKFGVYTTSEAFGMFFVPILGLYYKSPNDKLEINATLPISFDMNYSLGKYLNIGTDFKAFVRTFILSNEEMNGTYLHKNVQEISTYVQFGLFKNSVLLQLKGVYMINDYSQYNLDDQIDFGVSALLVGDDRTVLKSSVG